MYHIGKRQISHKKRNRRLAVATALVICLFIGAAWLWYRQLRPRTTIQQSAAVVQTIAAPKATTKTFDGGIFTIQLPISWQESTVQSQPYHIIAFVGNKSGSDEEQLDVYQDTIPHNFAVNYMVPVTPSGLTLGLVGTVSDNCANFTKPSSGPGQVAGMPAKWQGIDFLCDLHNTQRDVVGTSSAAGVNDAVVTSPLSGSHHFFFTYTNNNLSPDYSVFVSALSSFTLK